MTKPTNAEDVAKRITKACTVAGRSVVWLSGNSGIADKTLRRRLSSPTHFTLAELSALARVLECELEDFLTSRTHDEVAA